MRQQLANDGIIIAAVDVQRPAQREPRDLTQDQEAPRLRGRVRLTTRAMWQASEAEFGGRGCVESSSCWVVMIGKGQHCKEEEGGG